MRNEQRLVHPRIVKSIGAPLNQPRAIAIQFRYGFVADLDGLKVLDLEDPEKAHLIDGAFVPAHNANDVYVARTYAYVAALNNGIFIIDVKNPEKPIAIQSFTDGGKIDDARQVKIAMTNASLFAYVADGKNGLRIL